MPLLEDRRRNGRAGRLRAIRVSAPPSLASPAGFRRERMMRFPFIALFDRYM